ncbi:hypothetical protein CALCODRAFT_348077 [Calocera cornea HHB12733]|uniref:Uncharacterized protein n=1 Tax=Calocera cornea HHB12733 TaxID=1353952 RepID=A0A165JCR9_9BASI|nr:hypothetical protein CALCODRAFT_348077 [Calocera cornea HHB12733]
MAAVNRRTRGTRANPVSDENAVPSLAAARSARTATAGAKDNLTGLRPRSTSAAGKSVLSDVTKSTTTTTTKKRTALGPVTNVGETKLGGIKEDGAEGSKKAITKPGSATTRTTLLARQRAASSISSSTRPTSAEPIQPTAIRPPTRRTRANTVTAPAQKSQAAPVSDIPEEAQGDDDADAMEIDPPEMHSGIPIRPQVPGRGPSRLSTAAPSTTSVAKSTLTAATHQPLRARTTSAVTNGTARPIAGNAAVRRSKVLVAPRPVIAPQLAGDEDEQDEGAPVKKRRTSSMDADETDALQPRHPRAKALENLVVQKREVKRKTAHTASASTSRSSALVEDIISEKVGIVFQSEISLTCFAIARGHRDCARPSPGLGRSR